MTTRGLELGLTYSLNEKLIVSGNLSLLSGKLNYDPDKTDTANTGGHHIQFFSNGSFAASETEIRGLSRRPATANLSITYLPVKILRLRMDVRHAGARGDVFYDTTIKPYGALGTVSVNKYTLIDLSANVTIIKGLSAGLKLTNVLDTKYSEINGFTTRGAGIYGNIRYSF
jgi:outer membrane receptor protein involved in Fe transport